jgi:TRAP-type uncharacterized transport system fused permease subunit
LALLVPTALIAIVLGVGMPTIGRLCGRLRAARARSRANKASALISAHLFILLFRAVVDAHTTGGDRLLFAQPASATATCGRPERDRNPKLAIVAYLIPFVFAFNSALLFDGTWLEIGISCLTVYAAGHFLAEVLARRDAFGGGIRRWIVTLAALTLGGITAVVPPDNPIAISAAILGLGAVLVTTRMLPDAPKPA